MKKPTTHPLFCRVALANTAEAVMALANDAAGLDDDGWALIGPFGEWPKSRLVTVAGQAQLQNFLQVLDNDAADALMAKENTFFAKLKRAVVGVPVYLDHGDLKDVVPNAVSNSDGKKVKLGVVDQIRKGARGVEAHFALDNDGKAAVENGAKFPSAFWWAMPTGELRGDAVVTKPFKLISVALTANPNIRAVDALSNQKELAYLPSTNPEIMLKEKITGILIGKGIALANDAEEQLVVCLANAAIIPEDENAGPADKASRAAHLASAAANDKAGHLKAAAAHAKASDLHEAAGNKKAAAAHDAMSDYHAGCARNCP